MTDNRTTEKLMREFVAVACECEVRDYLISEYAERIEQAIADELNAALDRDEKLAERENSKLEHKLSNMETKLLKAQERIDGLLEELEVHDD